MPTPDGKSAVSLTELATGSYVLDMDTLGTRGPIRYRDRLKGPMTTAHPSVQPDGSLINFTSDVRSHVRPCCGVVTLSCKRQSRDNAPYACMPNSIATSLKA